MRTMMMMMRSTYVSRMCNMRRLWQNCAQTTTNSSSNNTNNGIINYSNSCFGCQIAWPPPSLAFPLISIATSRGLLQRRTTVVAHKQRTANILPHDVAATASSNKS